MSKQLKLGIGLPAYGGRVSMYVGEALFHLGYALASAENRFVFSSFAKLDVCGVDIARNRIVDSAIQAGLDWVLMIDSDTHWEPENAFDVLQMISSADHAGAAVVAAPVPKRDPSDSHLMVYRETGAGRVPLTREQLASEGMSDPLVDITSAATALMAIDVGFVKEKLSPPWFRFVWQDDSIKFLSEDLYFCGRVLAAGGRIVCDSRFIARHLQRPEVL